MWISIFRVTAREKVSYWWIWISSHHEVRVNPRCSCNHSLGFCEMTDRVLSKGRWPPWDGSLFGLYVYSSMFVQFFYSSLYTLFITLVIRIEIITEHQWNSRPSFLTKTWVRTTIEDNSNQLLLCNRGNKVAKRSKLWTERKLFLNHFTIAFIPSLESPLRYSRSSSITSVTI